MLLPSISYFFAYYCMVKELGKKIFRVVLLFIVVLTCSAGIKAQTQALAQPEVPNRKGKLFLVPELWLTFGTRTYIEIAPLVGYHVSDRLSVGIGPHYIYQSQKSTPQYPSSFQAHVFGGKGFARYALITNAASLLPIKLFNELFGHIEYEVLSLEKDHYYSTTGPEDERIIYQGFLVGGGFSQRVGMFNSISFMVLWNLNESSLSPYTNPVLRVGFNTYL